VLPRLEAEDKNAVIQLKELGKKIWWKNSYKHKNCLYDRIYHSLQNVIRPAHKSHLRGFLQDPKALQFKIFTSFPLVMVKSSNGKLREKETKYVLLDKIM
jgi:DNA-directed RNA polymerase beta' subunit